MIHLALYTVESGLEEEFGVWYETEHAPRLLRRPGWRRMWRYQCVEGQPFASLYELEDDLPTEPHVSAAPFRSDRFAARGLKDYYARTWRKIYSVGAPPDHRAWLNIVTVDIDAAHADAFSRWYNDVHVPEILSCPGWIANRRYECVDGEPRFLALYDLEDDTRPFASPEWEAAVGWDEHIRHIRGFHGFRVYRLIFECSA